MEAVVVARIVNVVWDMLDRQRHMKSSDAERVCTSEVARCWASCSGRTLELSDETLTSTLSHTPLFFIMSLEL